jgi:hypothetical protein
MYPDPNVIDVRMKPTSTWLVSAIETGRLRRTYPLPPMLEQASPSACLNSGDVGCDVDHRYSFGGSLILSIQQLDNERIEQKIRITKVLLNHTRQLEGGRRQIWTVRGQPRSSQNAVPENE